MSEIESTLIIVEPTAQPARQQAPAQTQAPAKPSQPLPQRMTDLDKRLRDHSARGQHAEAVTLLEQMRATAPKDHRITARLARYALATGDIAKAEAAAKQALAEGAADSWCYVALASAARRRGELAPALTIIDGAIALPGTFAELYLERAEILKAQGNRASAAIAYEAALNINPDIPQGQQLLGQMVFALGEKDRARLIFEQVIERTTNAQQPQLQLGNTLQSVGMEIEALAAYDKVIALNPKHGGVYTNRGAVLRRLKRFEEAMASYDRSIELDPLGAGAFYNRGNLLKVMGKLDLALDSYDRALALDPHNGTTHWNKALALLTKGDLLAGFREYEWRWRYPQFPTKPRNFSKPVWIGDALAGRTLFIYSEQGQGDMLQFLRFVPAVKAMGGKIVLEVHEELMSLIAAQGIADVLVPRGGPVPDFDLHVPIGSLAHRLGITLDSLPNQPYIKALPDTPEILGPKKGKKPRIGLVWAGNPNYSGDKERSMHFDQIRPLLDIKGVDWFALQKGYAEAQIPEDAPIQALGSKLSDWPTTAGVVGDLDLVISTCTSVPHLTGAMGLPAWVMLAQDADWRWLDRSRSDSPWYPSLRLFRQSAPGDWRGVVDAVGAALTKQFSL